MFLPNTTSYHVQHQALIQAKCNPEFKHILDSTRAIVFFGTPHQGLRVDALESMVEDISSSPEPSLYLLRQLRENSQFLETQKELLVHVWPSLQVVSFYETELTPTVKKVWQSQLSVELKRKY